MISYRLSDSEAVQQRLDTRQATEVGPPLILSHPLKPSVYSTIYGPAPPPTK